MVLGGTMSPVAEERVLGVDACKAGWVGIALRGGEVRGYFAARITDLVGASRARPAAGLRRRCPVRHLELTPPGRSWRRRPELAPPARAGPGRDADGFTAARGTRYDGLLNGRSVNPTGGLGAMALLRSYVCGGWH